MMDKINEQRPRVARVDNLFRKEGFRGSEGRRDRVEALIQAREIGFFVLGFENLLSISGFNTARHGQ